MRIVGGELRGRSLLSPKGLSTRPTSDRAREAVFNILHHARWAKRGLLQDATALDAFAGTGALGIEALSQGAKHAVFIERDHAAAKTCQDNIDTLGLKARAQLLRLDALRPPPRPPYIARRSLVFLDPPYGRDMGAQALAALAGKDWLEKGAVCVMEMAKRQPEPPPPGFVQHDERAYGVALVRFLEWAGNGDQGDSTKRETL